jgi:ribokinase
MRYRPSMVVMGGAGTDWVLSVPDLPSGHGDTTASEARRSPGGKGLNQAVAASAHGVDVALIAALADDPQAMYLEHHLTRMGVRRHLLVQRSACRTPTTLVLVDRKGEVAFIEVGQRDYLQLSVADIERASADIAKAAVVLATLELPLSSLEHARSVAQREGALFILNPAPIRTRDLARTRQLCMSVDVLIPNVAEMAALLELDPVTPAEDIAKEAALMFDGAVCLTAADRGCFMVTGNTISHHRTRQLGHVVDTSGASDVFCGVLGACLALSGDIRHAAEVANEVAERSTRYLGRRPVVQHP